MCPDGYIAFTRTRSPGWNPGSCTSAPARVELGNFAVDLLGGQDALFDEELLGRIDPALVVRHGFVLLAWNTLDHAPHLIGAADPLISKRLRHPVGQILPVFEL